MAKLKKLQTLNANIETGFSASAFKQTIFGDYNRVIAAEAESIMHGSGSGKVSM